MGWQRALYFSAVSVFREMETMSKRPAKSGAVSRPWMREAVPLVSIRVKIFLPFFFSSSMTQQMSGRR